MGVLQQQSQAYVCSIMMLKLLCPKGVDTSVSTC